MKTKIAYALVYNRKTEGLVLFDERLPLFWVYKVALKYQNKWGGKIIKVRIVDNQHQAHKKFLKEK